MWIHQEETKRITFIDELEIQISDGGYDEVGRNGTEPASVLPSAACIISAAAAPGPRMATIRWNLPKAIWP